MELFLGLLALWLINAGMLFGYLQAGNENNPENYGRDLAIAYVLGMISALMAPVVSSIVIYCSTDQCEHGLKFM